jgi:hypothetical protein
MITETVLLTLDRPVLRMRAELRGSRTRLILWTVGLPTQYRSDLFVHRGPKDFRWRRLPR